MAGIIPQDVIEQVRNATDIVQIIGQYLRLKKRGRNYLALCPFHTEKTASFSVSQDKQIFHCFGCGKGGNVFSFLMEHENMSFIEAVKHLAAKAGIQVPERKVDDAERQEIERLHYAHQLALDYYKSVLKSSKYKSQMNKYLLDTRKINQESIDFFQIGLAGEEWEGFLNYALKKGLYPKELLKAGLVGYSEKKDKYFDRFRLRLMIPIFNLTGKPIAFGGRALQKGEQAKYVNSPETPLYSKSNVLYGLNISRQFIREKNEVIIVEGYFDLISLFQAGIKNVVASSGTAFTSQQARLLARFCDKAFLFFDADSAGQTAAVRSVDALYDSGIEVMVMVPPEGEDPDSMAIKSGPEGIEKLKDSALRYLEFRVRDIDLKKQGIIQKEKLIKELAELGNRIGDITRRKIYFSEAADALQISTEHFYNIAPIQQYKKSEDRPLEWTSPKKGKDFEGDLLSLLLNFPEHIEAVQSKIAPDDFQSDSYSKIYSFLTEIYQIHGNVSINGLIDLAEDNTISSEITRLGQIDWDREKSHRILNDYLNEILGLKRRKIINKLKAELKLAEEKKDTKRAQILTDEIDALAELTKKRKK